MIFLGAQMDNQPIPSLNSNATLLPDDIHYARGEWTQDILLMPYTGEETKGGYGGAQQHSLTVSSYSTTVLGFRFAATEPHPKILLAPGCGAPDDSIKARAGFNPSPIPPPPPEKKIFGLKQRVKKTDAMKLEEAKIKRVQV